MAVFTVEFEIGPETRKLIERLAETVVMRVELGPQTREVIEDILLRRHTDPPRPDPHRPG